MGENMQSIKLFCIPYAGASAMVYSKWKTFLDHSIILYPVELAGRGKRFGTPFYEDLEQAVMDVYSLIKDDIEGSSFAFFGHSMGALIVYELCQKIKELKSVEPVHVFFSGRYPPHIVKKDKTLHVLADNEFKEEIFSLGGTPKEVYENEELLKYFLPILKADYKIIEKYEFKNKGHKLGCRITCLTGKYDKDVRYSEMLEWASYTNNFASVREFEGGHFFINNYTEEITNMINKALVGEYFETK
jgi:surfactin synthase thioesterase subunit